MKFKNSFGIRSEYNSIIQAFIKEAELLGWEKQEISEGYDSLYFNGNVEGESLKPGHYWSATWGGDNHYGFKLPEQWEEALFEAKEIEQEKPIVFHTDEDKIYYKAQSEPVRDGEEYYRVNETYLTIEKKAANKNLTISDEYVRFKTPQAAKDYVEIFQAARRAGVEIGSRGMFHDLPYSPSLPYIENAYGTFTDTTNSYRVTRILKTEEGIIVEVVNVNINNAFYYIRLSDIFPVKVGDYNAKVNGDSVDFGCQSFDKNELQTVFKLLTHPINAKIDIQGTDITVDLVNKLLRKLN